MNNYIVEMTDICKIFPNIGSISGHSDGQSISRHNINVSKFQLQLDRRFCIWQTIFNCLYLRIQVTCYRNPDFELSSTMNQAYEKRNVRDTRKKYSKRASQNPIKGSCKRLGSHSASTTFSFVRIEEWRRGKGGKEVWWNFVGRQEKKVS